MQPLNAFSSSVSTSGNFSIIEGRLPSHPAPCVPPRYAVPPKAALVEVGGLKSDHHWPIVETNAWKVFGKMEHRVRRSSVAMQARAANEATADPATGSICRYLFVGA